jgi:hypothetical protein
MEAEFRFENLRKRRKRVMKKLLIAIMAVTVLALGTAAYAHMWGGQGWGGGQHMWGGGPGYGPGAGMMYGGGDKESRKFFEETADLRKELHNKMFEYREARWAGDEEKVEALENFGPRCTRRPRARASRSAPAGAATAPAGAAVPATAGTKAKGHGKRLLPMPHPPTPDCESFFFPARRTDRETS